MKLPDSFWVILGLTGLVGLGFIENLLAGHTPVEVSVQNPTSNFSAEAVVEALWQAPNPEFLPDGAHKKQVLYGKELVAHTAEYLGPEGKVASISNGMNCQNCHLDAGTKVFGNNYASVAANYPRFRPRSGTVETVYKRINDCFERSLNGQALDTNGKEMKAIAAYILFLGEGVKAGTTPRGAGLKELPVLDRAADPLAGKAVYLAQCAACHQENGQGILAESGKGYTYPPLWGEHAYNDKAGLYRLSNFARFVKNNMPLGISHETTVLTDAEAWDVAAFVNSQPRPNKSTPHDWPDISKKPFDHPFGPYSDGFSEQQHKYGPFKPIQQAQKAAKKILS